MVDEIQKLDLSDEVRKMLVGGADMPSLTGTYGAVGDGIANDTLAVLAANAAGGVIFAPEGRYMTTLGFYDLQNMRTVGPGQIVLGNYAQARERAFLTTEVPDTSNDRTRMFEGDYAKSHVLRYSFVGASVGSTPITTYRNLTAATPELTVLDFVGGKNASNSDHASGRTGMVDRRRFMYMGGNGDLMFDSFYAECYTNTAGRTHFLACPAIGSHSAGYGAGGLSYGTYLQADGETISSDAGLTPGVGAGAAAIGRVRNYHRHFGATAMSQVWGDLRIQTGGPLPIDFGMSFGGVIRNGIDFAGGTFSAGAAVVLQSGKYVYWDGIPTTDPLGATFYCEDPGDTFDGMIGDERTIAIGAGKFMRISGLGVYANDAAAAAAGVPLYCLYKNLTTGAITERSV